MTARIAVVGLGRVGSVLAEQLAGAGYRVDRIGRRTLLPTSSHAGAHTDDVPGTVLVCVPDAAIGSAVLGLPEAWRAAEATVWLHTSGANTGAVFAGMVRGPVGSMHPLAPFPPVGAQAPSLAGVAFAVEGHPAALRTAEAIVATLDGKPIHVDAEARIAWHLAAVLASNGVYALLESAADVLRRSGLDPGAVLPSLAGLAAASAESAATFGHIAGATGPIVRGDARTVARHREWIATHDPALDVLYRELGDRLVAIAEQAGASSAATARVLAALHGRSD